MDYPLRVRPPNFDGFMRPAILDRFGREVASIPPGRNIWEWSDFDAKELVDTINAAMAAADGEAKS